MANYGTIKMKKRQKKVANYGIIKNKIVLIGLYPLEGLKPGGT